MSLRKVVFKAMNWQQSDEIEDEDREQFYISGLTAEGKSVLAKVDGFTPFVNVELPSRCQWDSARAVSFFEYLKECLSNWKIRKTGEVKDYSPIRFKVSNKFNLYHKKPGTYMLLVFKTNIACKNLQYFLEKQHDIPGVGCMKRGDFKVHEQNIDPIIKLTATRGIKLSSWIEAEEYIPEDENSSIEERKFSSADIDFYVKYKSLKLAEIPDTVQPKAKIVSWDIECYSHNHNSKLPDPGVKENFVSQISVIYTRYGNPPEKWKKYLLSLRMGCDFEVAGTKVYCYENEKDLLLGFKQLIQMLNPDILLGYNILKFDYNYLIKRAELLEIYDKFIELGRIFGIMAIKVTKDWASSAYGEQKFEFLECQGRLNLDLLPEIERNFKFDTYSLDFVANHFLKENKKAVSAKQMFKLTKFAMLTKNYHGHKITSDYLADIKEIADSVFVDEEGVTEDFYQSIKKATKKNILSVVSQAMAIIGDYCVHDSVLPLKLIFKLNTFIVLEQMSNIFCVPISYLQTRGQQVKILAQVYRHTLYNNYVIPFKKYNELDEDEKYEGATVIDAVPGYYENIPNLDFASLYPTVMIANNIDHTTYIDPENDTTPDEECNIIEFESHRGCIHDKEKRKTKVKKENILCGHFKHKFLKVIEKDGKIYREGVLPHLLRTLLTERKKVKVDLSQLSKKLKEDKTLLDQEKADIATQLIVLDAKQLAIKVSANSMYGSMGAKTGFMPLIAGAASVTAGGRQYIRTAINYVLKNFKNSKLVYGDSVTKDTPILVRDQKGRVDILAIEDLATDWEDYEDFKPEHLEPLDKKDEDILNFVDKDKWKDSIHIENLAARLNMNKTKRRDKQKAQTEYEVWTDEGWTKIKKVIRHKVNKNIYRVNTHTGVVDVTEDHSLLDPDKKKIKPKDVKIGSHLLHSFPSKFENPEVKVFENLERDTTKIICNGCRKMKPFVDFHANNACKKRHNKNGICKQCLKKPSTVANIYISEYNYTKPYRLTPDEAWVWGFFMADGSCSKSGPKKSWALNNQDLALLEKAKNILESVEPYDFKILDTMKSSGVYKLVPNNARMQYIVDKYSVMYDKDRFKKVPKEVLNGSFNVRESFYKGYYAGDGYKKVEYQSFSNKGKIGSQGLWYLVRSLGYKNSCVNIRDDKPSIYRIQAFENKQKKKKTVVKKVINLGLTDDYVYDLETECGRFQAGVGELIVKNTDSALFSFQGFNTKETFEIARKAAKDVTALFPPPVELELECVYGKFLLLTKKRYVAYIVDEEGNYKSKEGNYYGKIKKGVVLKRRDNTHYLKDVYGQTIDSVMEKADEKKVLYDLYDNIHKLFTRQVDAKDLVIYKGVKDIISYAKKKELPDPSGKIITQELTDKRGIKHTIQKPEMITYFLGRDKNPLMDVNKRPYKTKNPLDPNLLYDNSAHLMLALKMKARGDDVPPNTRLQYVFLDTGEKCALQGEKAEDYTFYRENKNAMRLKLDPLYYLEKQLIKPLTEVIDVLYRNEKYKYETLEARITNCESFIFKNVDSCIKESILNMGEFIVRNFGNVKIGSYSKRVNMVRTQIKKIKSPKVSKNFEDLAHLYYIKKSELVLDKIEKKYGIKKRTSKKPNRATGLIVKDGTIMKDIFKYRTCYQDVVRHLRALFYDLVTEEELLEKAEMFAKLNKEREKKFKALEEKNSLKIE